VTVAVVDRKTMKLGKKDLLDYFGADGEFSCKIDILYFSISEADLQMETYSGVSSIDVCRLSLCVTCHSVPSVHVCHVLICVTCHCVPSVLLELKFPVGSS